MKIILWSLLFSRPSTIVTKEIQGKRGSGSIHGLKDPLLLEVDTGNITADKDLPDDLAFSTISLTQSQMVVNWTTEFSCITLFDSLVREVKQFWSNPIHSYIFFGYNQVTKNSTDTRHQND